MYYLYFLLFATLFFNTSFARGVTKVEDLFSMNVKELAQIEVTSVSKRKENAAKAPAAIYVITHEEIQRSGATNLAEALRFVPGVQVSRINSNRWNISIRGFNEGFSNKLLVLIDGRSVYTPLFSGMYWDTQNPPLEDIERIEVIRGSASSTFGANAVNGIINVITKKASHTQGGLATALSGKHERFKGYARYGGKIGDRGYYRLYAQHMDQDEVKGLDNQGIKDDWTMSQIGFRSDIDLSHQSKLTLQGDAYNGVKSGRFNLPVTSAPFEQSFTRDEDLSGANLLARLNHHHSNNSESILQAYLDFTVRDHITLEQSIYTGDLDYQHNWDKEKHSFTTGFGYRFIFDNLNGTPYNFYPGKSADTHHIFSAFIQDKITLLPETLFLTLGSKLEYNDYTQFELQPTARLAWHINDNHTFWGAFSRAVRTPNRAERDVRVVVGNSGATFFTWNGHDGVKSEELIGIEFGYKATPHKNLSIDMVAFANEYDHLRTFEQGNVFSNSSVPNFPQHNELPFLIENKGSGEVYGFELSAGWNVTKDWLLRAHYSALKMNLHIDEDSRDVLLERDEGESARNMLNLLSRMDLSRNITLDSNLSFVDNLSKIDIDPYIRFDTRIAWTPQQGVELSVVGQNLFDNTHNETKNSFYSDPSEIGRIIYGKIAYQF